MPDHAHIAARITATTRLRDGPGFSTSATVRKPSRYAISTAGQTAPIVRCENLEELLGGKGQRGACRKHSSSPRVRVLRPRAHPDRVESGCALDSLIGACPFLKTGSHFSGTCASRQDAFAATGSSCD